MALPVNGSTHLIPTSTHLSTQKGYERLSWPSWLTYSGWFTHISGHPSAAGRAQDRESSPARDRRSTTVPRHQLPHGPLSYTGPDFMGVDATGTGRMPFLPPNQQRQSTEGINDNDRHNI